MIIITGLITNIIIIIIIIIIVFLHKKASVSFQSTRFLIPVSTPCCHEAYNKLNPEAVRKSQCR
jgi:hypothetical protein